ncbi:MAG: HD domain-containing protein [Ruminococcus sp.]|nr:HD domain-containing protein [Ruminococcus sp.]
MNNKEKLKAAHKYATQMHEGQFRKGGKPYITHPCNVAEMLQKKGYGTDYQIAGLFHDLLEDTDAKESEIEKIGGTEVLKAVQLLTKQKGYDMSEYISGIKNNPIAKAVKAADRLDNLRSAIVTDNHFKQKYILESIDWYMDFDPEIPDAIMALADTLDNSLYEISRKSEASAVKTEKPEAFVLHGDICYSVSPDCMKTAENGYIVCENGKSKGVYETLPSEYSSLPLHDYSGKLIIPGLVDLHIHAPQYAFRGMGMDMELMEWLQNHAYPEEAKYSDCNYAERAYKIFAEAMKKSATTHACIFATRHRKATEILMELMEKTGIVSYVGKVNMDREAPEELREPTADYSVLDTFGWITNTAGRYERTKPILTPRFIPCCTPKLLEQLGELQTAYNLPVQSHLSENQSEIEFVKQLVPEAEFYGDAYDSYGLFGKEQSSGKPVKTIMAHCVYSADAEIQRMKKNGVFVAHCPASNTNLSSGIAPMKKYLDIGLNTGLGSDVAGGHTESMFTAIRNAVQMSKHYCHISGKKDCTLTFREAFYLATKGGGNFFGKVGSFEEGFEFSAVILDDSKIPSPEKLPITDRTERAVYSSLDLFGICAKYSWGKKIYENLQGDVK